MKPSRQPNKTSFITGEGIADRIFLSYLKSLYIERNIGHKITVNTASDSDRSGGSPQEVMRNALLACSKTAGYDAVVVLLDGDVKPASCEDLYLTAKKHISLEARKKIPSIYACIVANPCLEGLLLETKTGFPPPKVSEDCKRSFASNFGKAAQKLSKEDYRRLLPKTMIDQALPRIPALNRLVTFFKLHGNDDSFCSWFNQPHS